MCYVLILNYFAWQKLVVAGAKKVAIVSIPPIGCVPSQRTLEGGLLRSCAAPQNQLATLFNNAFQTRLQGLQQQNPGTRLVLADIYGFLLDVILRPTNYGTFSMFQQWSFGACGLLSSESVSKLSWYWFSPK